MTKVTTNISLDDELDRFVRNLAKGQKRTFSNMLDVIITSYKTSFEAHSNKVLEQKNGEK